MKKRLILLALFPLLALGCAFSLFVYLLDTLFWPSAAWEAAIAVDDLGNVSLNGALGQTISSRAAHNRGKWWGCVLCKILNEVDPGHCDRALTDPVQNLEEPK